MEPTPTACGLVNSFRRSQPIIVNSSMSSTEISSALIEHGCVDLTEQLDHGSCSTFAVSNGGSGDVFLGRLQNGTRVAIKVFRLHLVHGQSGKHLKHAAKELHTWSKCQHPNVLQLLGLVEFRGQIGMVSPWIEQGNLRAYLDKQPEVDRYQLCFNICDGLAYLHSIKIIHGDLKGANVLISGDGSPLLTDFGNSILGDQSLLFTKSVANLAISARWTAPEVLNGSVSSSYAADVFSLGMTLLETITGKVPYHELERDLAVIAAISIRKVTPNRPELQFPTNSAREDALWKLLTYCWEYDPRDRPDAARVRDMVYRIWKGTSEFCRAPLSNAVERIPIRTGFPRREPSVISTVEDLSEIRKARFRRRVPLPLNAQSAHSANQATGLTVSHLHGAHSPHYFSDLLIPRTLSDDPSEPGNLAFRTTRTNQGEGSTRRNPVYFDPIGDMDVSYGPIWPAIGPSFPYSANSPYNRLLGYPVNPQIAPSRWGPPGARLANSGVGDSHGPRTREGFVTSTEGWHTAREGTLTPPDPRISCD